MDIEIGNVIKMKKGHPCGGTEWKVLRTGADFRLECTTCKRQVMISRRDVEKSIKEVKKGLETID